LDKIGLQLYTVRDQMKLDFESTIARVAQAGYQEVEFAGYYNRSPAERARDPRPQRSLGALDARLVRE